MENCIFCKIANRIGDNQVQFHFEDDDIVAFDDIHPKAPVHILVVSKNHIQTLNDIDETHIGLVGKMILVASKLAQAHRVDETGYRLIFNTNNHAGQAVDHIHLHLLGGKQLGKMVE